MPSPLGVEETGLFPHYEGKILNFYFKKKSTSLNKKRARYFSYLIAIGGSNNCHFVLIKKTN